MKMLLGITENSQQICNILLYKLSLLIKVIIISLNISTMNISFTTVFLEVSGGLNKSYIHGNFVLKNCP